MAIEVKRAGVRRAQCSCSMPAVWWALSYVRGALVIFHSPRSCAHVVREKDVGSFHRLVGAGTYAPPSPVPLLTSGIGEGDAVFGAAERLRACVRYAAEKYHPRAVFIGGSCVSGIIGDDTRAVAEEMEEELGLPVVALEARPCETQLKDAWRGALAAEELARALINPDDAASSTLKQLIDDALVTTAVASRFLGRTTVTWGEGLGGSQALFAAALLPKAAIATMALNPLFADNATTLRTVVGYGDTPQSDAAIDAVGLLDSACAAELVRVPALIGTALLDQSVLTEGTFALYNRIAGQKEIRVYPKFGHERINQFENEQINYLCEVISGLCHN